MIGVWMRDASAPSFEATFRGTGLAQGLWLMKRREAERSSQQLCLIKAKWKCAD